MNEKNKNKNKKNQKKYINTRKRKKHEQRVDSHEKIKVHTYMPLLHNQELHIKAKHSFLLTVPAAIFTFLAFRIHPISTPDYFLCCENYLISLLIHLSSRLPGIHYPSPHSPRRLLYLYVRPSETCPFIKLTFLFVFSFSFLFLRVSKFLCPFFFCYFFSFFAI